MKRSFWMVALMLIGTVLMGQAISQAQGAKEIPKETQQDIGPQLVKNFTFEPFSPPMPDHLWMKADPDKVIFLHFAKPVSETENKLIFVGEGIKGKFCAENQPAQGKTGFVHFHSLKPSHVHQEKGQEMAHGGEPGQEGFWLRHIAVDEFDMMGTHFTPGVAHNFMPTPPPKCK